LTRAVEGAEDEVKHARTLIKSHDVGAADVLIAVAASGTTPFTLAASGDGQTQGAPPSASPTMPARRCLPKRIIRILLERDRADCGLGRA